MSAMENYDVVEEIQSMLAESEGGLEIWNKVFHFILQSKAYIIDLIDLGDTIHVLVQKLLSSVCDDSEIVSRIMCMHRRYIEVGYGLDLDDDTVDYVLEPLDFENSFKLNVNDNTGGDSFLTAVNRGDLVIVKLCIKYGKIGKGNLFLEDIRFFLANFKLTIKQYMFHQDVFHYEHQWAEDFVDYLQHTRGKIGNNQRGIQRICTLLNVLSKLFYKIPGNHRTHSDDEIQCLRLYFNVMNEPFIAQDEVRDFLKLIFAEEERCEEVVEEIISIYRGMFPPEITLVYEPRTLKHQSRCAVRKYLSCQTESVTLPNFISQQNVPLIIKELLLGAPESSS